VGSTLDRNHACPCQFSQEQNAILTLSRLYYSDWNDARSAPSSVRLALSALNIGASEVSSKQRKTKDNGASEARNDGRPSDS